MPAEPTRTNGPTGLVTREGAAVPLRSVDVRALVQGGRASVTLRQSYEVSGTRPVEAIYVFPLPSDAVVAGFRFECAGRRLEGRVLEREAAFKGYADAVTDGHGAALLEQERPNVFTASVGNLLPGEPTVVEIEYLQPLEVEEGAVRFMLPTVVAPRYVPGTPAGDRTAHGHAEPTDRVPDADRITPRLGDAPYVLSLSLVFDLGEKLRVESPSHAITVTHEGRQATVRLASAVALDRDLVVVARGAEGGAVAGAVSDREAGKDGVVAITVIPDLFDVHARPDMRPVVFLLDRSGSMGGASMPQARDALKLCLRQLREGDRFNVAAFDDRVEWLSGALLPFTQKTLETADRWLDSIDARGGTELLEPLVEAVRAAGDGVVVLLTDGQVANEAEIERRVMEARKGTRVHSFGIGTAVSDALLRGLATRTGGGVEFIHPGERIEDKVVATFARATAARVTDLKVEFSGVEIEDLVPATPTALVDGVPVTFFGTYRHATTGRLELRGTLRGAPFLLKVPVELPETASRPGLHRLRAAATIRELESRFSGDTRRDARLRERVVELATTHGISSSLTSFLVVDKREGDRRTDGAPEVVDVPVSAPAGWSMFQRLRSGSLGGGGFPAHVTGAMAVPMSMPPPPMPMASAAPAPARASAKGGLLSAIGGLFGGAERDRKAAAPPRAARRLEEADDGVASFEGGVPAPSGGPATVADPDADVLSILRRQLASGLFSPANGGTDTLDGTRAALVALHDRHGVDVNHRVHGALLRKAVEALSRLLTGVTAPSPAHVAAAAAALAVAGTGRTRETLLAVLRAHAAYAALLTAPTGTAVNQPASVST